MQSGSTYHAASYAASLSHPSFSWVFRRRRLALITLITVFQTQGRPFSGLCHDENSLRSLFKIIKIYRSVMIWSILVWYGQICYIIIFINVASSDLCFEKNSNANHVQIQSGSCHHFESYCYVTNPKPETQANVTNYCDIFDQILWPKSNMSEILNDI